MSKTIATAVVIAGGAPQPPASALVAGDGTVTVAGLQATFTGRTTKRQVTGTVPRNRGGRRAFGCYVDSLDASALLGIGLTFAGKDSAREEFAYTYFSDGTIKAGSTTAATVTAYAQDDTISIALDAQNGLIEFWLAVGAGAPTLEHTEPVRTANLFYPYAIDLNTSGTDTVLKFAFNAVPSSVGKPWDEPIVYTDMLLTTHGFVTRTDDTEFASRYFAPYLKNDAETNSVMSLAIWGKQNSEPGLSSINLDNKGGQFDTLLEQELTGRAVRVYLVEIGFSTGVPLAVDSASWVRVATQTIDRAPEAPDLLTARIIMRESTASLNEIVQRSTYNDPANAALVGKERPITFGQVLSAPAVKPSTSTLTFEIFDKPGFDADVSLMRDQGAPLTTPASWTPATYGALKLAADFGKIVMDTVPAATSDTEQALLNFLTRAGIPASAIDTAALAAIATDFPEDVGIFSEGRDTFRAVLDQIVNGVMGWYTFDELQTFTAGTLTEPTGTPVFMVDNSTWLGELNVTPDLMAGVVSKIGYQKNWYAYQAGELATGLSTADANMLKEPYRAKAFLNVGAATDDNYARIDKSKKVPDGIYQTLFNAATGAERVRDRLNDIIAKKRSFYRLQVQTADTTLIQLKLGAVAELRLPRYGLDAGKLVRVVAKRYFVGRSRAEIVFWG